MVDNKNASDEDLIRRQRFERAFLRAHTLPPPPSCPISWPPNALAPVFHGVREYSPTDGAPARMRVFFPSLDGSPFYGAMLKGCGRYPLVLFVHGQCQGAVDLFKQWYLLPHQLARSGYVVAVPDVVHGVDPSGNVAMLRNVLTWMRSTWEHRDAIMAAPATGIIGHSWGGILGAMVANSENVACYASLSSDHTSLAMDPLPVLGLTVPKLFIMGREEPAGAGFPSIWDRLTLPKHRAVFTNGKHWDYLPSGQTPCDQSRGPCQLIAPAAADLVTMLLANYLPPELVPNLPKRVPPNLVPPPLVLTPEQQFYAGLHLYGFNSLAGAAGCEVTVDFALPLDREVPYVRFTPVSVADHDVRAADLVPVFTDGGGTGTPWVDTQNPVAGTMVPEGSEVRMYVRHGEIP